MKIKIHAVGIALVLGLLGCGDDSETTTVEPQFSSIKANILDTKCATCHGTTTASTLGDNVTLVTYNDVLAKVTPGFPNISLFYTQVSSGVMPKGGPALPQQHIDAIKTWIENGALND